jgi:hypothetical protein
MHKKMHSRNLALLAILLGLALIFGVLTFVKMTGGA